MCKIAISCEIQVKPDIIQMASAGIPAVEEKFSDCNSRTSYSEIHRALVASADVVAIGMDSCEYSICY